ncbi:SDR family oxidoreductase [Xanthomonas cannabis]|uniref:SDR family oxidoreductase n=1 Tax=Xanthomonas cannabis TaxID=1885674 RepID=UPI000A41D66F|nr:SDR family oxidoreductase [Xanthomonas cannabis]
MRSHTDEGIQVTNIFEGNKVLVVGGTSGIGLESARNGLAGSGGAVIVGQRADKTEQARAELAQSGEVSALTANVSAKEGLTGLMADNDKAHADVNLLVNATGVFFPRSFLEYTQGDYDQYMH